MNKKVTFIGATREQVTWGSRKDPNEHLRVGEVYELVDKNVYSWHTDYFLKGFPGLNFPAAAFEIVK